MGGSAGKFEYNILYSFIYVHVWSFAASYRYYALLITVCVILFVSRGTGGVNESIRKKDLNN